MSLVDRAKNIVLTPKTEWPAVSAETNTTGGLITYTAILAVLPALALFLGFNLFAGPLASLMSGYIVTFAIVFYLAIVLSTIIIGFVANALSPQFGGKSDQLSAMKLVTAASTPVAIGGLAALLADQGITWIGIVGGVAYAGYLIFLGAKPLMNVPEDKAPVYAGILGVGWLIALYLVWRIGIKLFIGFPF